MTEPFEEVQLRHREEGASDMLEVIRNKYDSGIVIRINFNMNLSIGTLAGWSNSSHVTSVVVGSKHASGHAFFLRLFFFLFIVKKKKGSWDRVPPRVIFFSFVYFFSFSS